MTTCSPAVLRAHDPDNGAGTRRADFTDRTWLSFDEFCAKHPLHHILDGDPSGLADAGEPPLFHSAVFKAAPTQAEFDMALARNRLACTQTRVDADGKSYSHQQFVHHYGDEVAWHAAVPTTTWTPDHFSWFLLQTAVNPTPAAGSIDADASDFTWGIIQAKAHRVIAETKRVVPVLLPSLCSAITATTSLADTAAREDAQANAFARAFSQTIVPLLGRSSQPEAAAGAPGDPRGTFTIDRCRGPFAVDSMLQLSTAITVGGSDIERLRFLQSLCDPTVRQMQRTYLLMHPGSSIATVADWQAMMEHLFPLTDDLQSAFELLRRLAHGATFNAEDGWRPFANKYRMLYAALPPSGRPNQPAVFDQLFVALSRVPGATASNGIYSRMRARTVTALNDGAYVTTVDKHADPLMWLLALDTYFDRRADVARTVKANQKPISVTTTTAVPLDHGHYDRYDHHDQHPLSSQYHRDDSTASQPPPPHGHSHDQPPISADVHYMDHATGKERCDTCNGHHRTQDCVVKPGARSAADAAGGTSRHREPGYVHPFFVGLDPTATCAWHAGGAREASHTNGECLCRNKAASVQPWRPAGSSGQPASPAKRARFTPLHATQAVVQPSEATPQQVGYYPNSGAVPGIQTPPTTGQPFEAVRQW
jgi:hypothetical protein